MEHISIQVNKDLSAYRKYNIGDIIFIPATTMHKIMKLTESNEILTISYNAAVLKSMVSINEFSEFLYKRERYIITAQCESYATICSAIENICELKETFSLGGKVKIVSNFLQIISQVIEEFDLEVQNEEAPSEQIRPVIEYIEKNYMHKIKIEELTKVAYMCNDSLFQLFKKETGITPIKYISNVRIEESIRLLTTTELSLEEIAERTGFGSATYMNRVFRQKLGCTPGEFRSAVVS